VASARIEQHSATMKGRADVVSARALASFDELCRLAYPYLRDESLILLLKGQDFVHEEREAAKSWDYDLVTSQSVTDPGGCVVRVRHLKPRKPDARI
jgi:16S rRNA (guanine527-N7)-methyltransferase